METTKGLIIAGILFLASASLGIVAMMDMSSSVNDENEKSLTIRLASMGEWVSSRTMTVNLSGSCADARPDISGITRSRASNPPRMTGGIR